MRRKPKDFDVVTWNTHRQTEKILRAHIKNMLRDNVTVFECQEVKQPDAFNKEGLAYRHVQPEFLVAWDQDRWELVNWEELTLSDKDYWVAAGNKAVRVTLHDILAGEEVEFISAHPPAHVQVPKHKTFKKVMAVLRDAAKNWRKISRRAWRRFGRVVIIGMDGNVDHTKGWRPQGGWEFMYGKILKLIMPKRGTHGSRIIDYFLVVGVRRVGNGELYNVDSDHLAYRQTFRYRWRMLRRAAKRRAAKKAKKGKK